MAGRRDTVIVPIHSLVERALPPVCAITGEPTEKLSRFRFSDSNLYRAVFAAFIRAPHRRKFVAGSVPLVDRLVTRRRQLRWAATITGIGGLIAGITAVALQDAAPLNVMWALLAIAALALIIRTTISPQGVMQGQYVWLTRVDATFADATVDLITGARRPEHDEDIIRAGIGPIPIRALAGIALWLFVILWIALR